MGRALLFWCLLLCLPCADAVAGSVAKDGVETALIVSVDVSGSIDDSRYRLQMEGLAEALEDPGVVTAVSRSGGILFMLMTWADHPRTVVDWRRIASKQDAAAVASAIRKLPLQGGDFTCIGRMFRTLSDLVLPSVPVPATRVVIDVSGDGIDNCSDPEAMREDRDDVLATGATINGLPILVPGENDTVNVGSFRAPGYGLSEMARDPDHEQTTLDRWYNDHVVGGPGSFILMAHGYGDFTKALRRKFVMEISDRASGPTPSRLAAVADR